MSETGFQREYRQRSRQRAQITLVVLWVALAFMRLTSPALQLDLTDWVLIVALTAMIIYTFLHAKRGRTLIGPDGITVIGVLRQHRLPWADIHDIRVEPLADWRSRAGAQWVVRAYTHTGRRYALPHVDSEQLDTPADAEPVHTAWLQHRGPDWAPHPDTEGLIRRQAARRKAWHRAAIAAFIAFVGTLVLSIALLFDDVDLPEAYVLIVPVVVLLVAGAALDLRARSAKA
ncbi:PH domain-containing protein [Streptomyces sp. NPDC059373]